MSQDGLFQWEQCSTLSLQQCFAKENDVKKAKLKSRPMKQEQEES